MSSTGGFKMRSISGKGHHHHYDFALNRIMNNATSARLSIFFIAVVNPFHADIAINLTGKTEVIGLPVLMTPGVFILQTDAKSIQCF
jgi:hypothetical protein